MSIFIKSNRLTVEIAQPNEWPANLFRFDKSSVIRQVTLDGKYQFCSREPDFLDKPCTRGYGLNCEFRWQSALDEAQIGSQFPKIGVGLLTKFENDRFNGWKHYEMEPQEFTAAVSEDGVIFESFSKPCMGYSVHLVRNIRAVGNEVIMSSMLENCGEKEIVCDEYSHNFITIEHLSTGEDYYLQLPVVDQTGKPNRGGTICGKGAGFTFDGYSRTASKMPVPGEDILRDRPFSWKLSNKKSTCVMSEKVSFEPTALMVWGIDDIISTESFFPVDIKPGEKTEWSRTWTFDC